MAKLHRFLPIYASWHGAKIIEIIVNHHPRRGSSKYGLERVVKVLLDLLVVKFLDRAVAKPRSIPEKFRGVRRQTRRGKAPTVATGPELDGVSREWHEDLRAIRVSRLFMTLGAAKSGRELFCNFYR
jgi:hypothetical protein